MFSYAATRIFRVGFTSSRTPLFFFHFQESNTHLGWGGGWDNDKVLTIFPPSSNPPPIVCCSYFSFHNRSARCSSSIRPRNPRPMATSEMHGLVIQERSPPFPHSQVPLIFPADPFAPAFPSGISLLGSYSTGSTHFSLRELVPYIYSLPSCGFNFFSGFAQRTFSHSKMPMQFSHRFPNPFFR